MTPAELDSNFIPALLYYCNASGDTTRYFNADLTQLSPSVGTIAFDDTGTAFVDAWNMVYAKPSNLTLQTPLLSDVLTFFNNAYVNPQLVNNARTFPSFTSSQLNSMETSNIADGAMILNNTTKQVFQFVLRLPYTFDGRGMLRAATSTSNPVSFTAATSRVLPLSGFVSDINTNNIFSISSVGVITYAGVVPRVLTFNFRLNCSLPAAVAHTLNVWLSKNGDLTIGTRRLSRIGNTATGTAVPVTFTVDETVLLMSGDTFQLAGQSSSTLNYTFVTAFVTVN